MLQHLDLPLLGGDQVLHDLPDRILVRRGEGQDATTIITPIGKFIDSESLSRNEALDNHWDVVRGQFLSSFGRTLL